MYINQEGYSVRHEKSLWESNKPFRSSNPEDS